MYYIYDVFRRVDVNEFIHLVRMLTGKECLVAVAVAYETAIPHVHERRSANSENLDVDHRVLLDTKA